MSLHDCMGIAGSVPTAIFGLWWLLGFRTFSVQTGKRILRLAVILYLVPVQMLKYLLPESLFATIYGRLDDLLILDGYTSFAIGGTIYWWNAFQIVWALVGILSAFVFFGYETVAYVLKTDSLKKSASAASDSYGAVPVCFSRNVHTPYTIGIFHPKIIFPVNAIYGDTAGLIYRHELAHLRHKDSLWKFFCVLTVFAHWYNPMPVLLFVFYSMICEYTADKEATESCTDTEKKEYLKILVKMSSDNTKMPMIWKNNFLGTKKLLKRRIDLAMKKENKRNFAISMTATAISVLISAITVFAYEPVQEIEVEGSILEDGTDIYFEESGSPASVSDGEDGEDIVNSETWFTDEDGDSVLCGETQNESRVLCIHSYKSGYLSVHKLKSNGGCVVYKYKGKRCSKCGRMVFGDLYSTTTYVTCPH